MPKLVTWMNNQRVGELTKLANGAHTFIFRLAAVIDSRHFTTSFQHFRYWVVQEYTSAISNWQWGLTHPKAKKRQSIKFIRDIFWRQQRC